MSEAQFRHEDVSAVPRGYKVRTVKHPSGHRVRIAFPPGPRHTGAGKLVSILHPKHERNPCEHNPLQELVKDSKGRQWWINILGNDRTGFTGEGYPMKGERFKRTAGRPVIAHGQSEEEAGDRLSEKMDSRNPRYVAEMRLVRKSLHRKIVEAAAEQGRTVSAETDPRDGRLSYRLDGTLMSPGEAADSLGVRIGNPKSKIQNPKSRTREQVGKMQEKAVHFLRYVAKDKAKADEIEGMSVADYAEKKGVTIENPKAGSRESGVGSRQYNAARYSVRIKNLGDRWVTKATTNDPEVARSEAARLREMAPRAEVKIVERKNPKRASIYTASDKSRWDIRIEKLHEGYHARAYKLGGDRSEQDRSFYQTSFFPTAKQSREAMIWNIEGAVTGEWSKRNPKSRKNQAQTEAAAALYEIFHGKKPKEIIELHQDVLRRQDYAALGQLVEITLPDLNIALDFESDKVLLAASPNGKQMYVIGGNQNLGGTLSTLADGEKDFVDLGEVGAVVYRTRKDFDKFEEIDYKHKMGEGGHEKPRAMYDNLNKQIYFVGGEYDASRHEGIVH